MFKQKHYACVNININCTHKHEQGVLPRKVDYDKNLHLFTKKGLLRISRKNVKKTMTRKFILKLTEVPGMEF